MKKRGLLLLVAAVMLLLCSCSCRHEFETKEAADATCTSVGMTAYRVCTKCGVVESGGQVIEALGHAEEVDEAVAATCTATGLTEGKHCSRCGEVLTAQETVPMLEHTYVMDETVNPTCTEEGSTAGFHCSECGMVFFAQEAIPALGHTEAVDEAVAATCTETGLTEGKHCSVCGEILIAQEVTEATGHHVRTVSAEEFPVAELAVVNGAACVDCDTVFPFVTDEASDSSEIEEQDDGTLQSVELVNAWNLKRVQVYGLDGTLQRSTIQSVQDAEGPWAGTLMSADYLGGEMTNINVYFSEGDSCGIAYYSVDGSLTDYLIPEFDENGRETRGTEFNADGSMICYSLYDYNQDGVLARSRRFSPEGELLHTDLPWDVELDQQIIVGQSKNVYINVFECGVELRSREEVQKIGMVPRGNKDVNVEVIDFLTGETVRSLTGKFGEDILMEALPMGYYIVRASSEGLTDWQAEGVYMVRDDMEELGVPEEGIPTYEIILDNPNASFGDGFAIRLTDEKGKPRAYQTEQVAISRINSGFIYSVPMDSNSEGLLSFHYTSLEDAASVDYYYTVQFCLRDDCIFGYYSDSFEFSPILLDGSEEYQIVK